MSNHLWQSTLFALAAGLLAFALRRNRPEVRFWLWFAASAKFLLPFALLTSLGTRMPAPAPRAMPPAVTQAVVQIAEPFSAPADIIPSRAAWRPGLLLLAWVCGSVAVAAIRFRAWLRLRAGLCSGSPVVMPAVVGLWRPRLLLPAGIEERLTPPQLAAVVAHEMCHVRRRDNLLAAIHMVVEAAFWFHPLVWWIGARLVEERERACDEEVLRQGSDPDVYAEAILNVCKLYAETPLPCVAGVTGADLKKRIAAILGGGAAQRLNRTKKLAIAAAGIAALAAPVLVGILKTPALRAQATPKFEVASIKPCDSAGGRGRSGAPVRAESPDRLSVDCQTVAQMVQRAYGATPSAPVSGGPAWVTSDRYAIEAKAEGAQSRQTLYGPMLRALLEDRFRLQLHRESRQIPVYLMTVAKNAPKLQETPEGRCSPDPKVLEAAVAAGQRPSPCGIVFARKESMPGIFVVSTRGLSLPSVAEELTRFLDRPVIDRTGVDGRFDLRAEFAPDETTPGLRSRAFFAPPDGGAAVPGAPILNALEKQAGLHFEPSGGAREFLVIDRVEKPAEN